MDILELLLRQEGGREAVRIRDVKGNSPAHDAAENGHANCLRLLVEAGLDIYEPDEVNTLYIL